MLSDTASQMRPAACLTRGFRTSAIQPLIAETPATGVMSRGLWAARVAQGLWGVCCAAPLPCLAAIRAHFAASA